jgi:hypothetical protein
MKCIFPCVLAMFIIASTCGYAQEPISGTSYGEKTSTTLKTYTLSTAYPLAKSLLGQKIIVTGTANSVTTVSKTPVWFVLVDGMTKVSVVNKMAVTTTVNPIGQKVAVVGSFAVNSITNVMEFLATGITIASEEMTKASVVYGEPIPSTAKVMTLATAMPMAKSLAGQKIVVTGTASTLVVSLKDPSWFTLTDGTTKVPVINKITVSVVKPANGTKLSLYGSFVLSSTGSISFYATSLRIP